MKRFVSCLLLISVIISGCISVNRNPDILLQEPYTKVNYVAEVTKQHKTVEVIQVQTRGLQANEGVKGSDLHLCIFVRLR